MNYFTPITNFLKSVNFEIKRVKWPTKEQIIKYTLVVIFLSLALAVFLGVADFLFSFLLNKFILF